MTKQTILVGTVANDGTGDTLRSAGLKINNNFNETYSDILYIHEKSNVSSNLSQTIFNNSNTANILAQAAYTQANTAANTAQAAFNAANTATANIDFTESVISLTGSATETLINITPSGPVAGWAYLQLPTNDTANTSNTRLHNDAGNIEFATGDFSTGGSNSHIWYLNSDGSLTFPDATVQTTAFTGNTITGPDTANVRVNLNGTVSVTTDDEGSISRWTYDSLGNIILPTEAGLVTTGTVSVGYYDTTASSAVGSLASFYSTSANNAVVEITARNDMLHQNKLQIISDGATGDEYINIELYDAGQNYGTMSWKFHNSGKLESAIGVAPTTSIGVAGDKRGMIIHTTTHMYFCTADYDGTTDIWRRMEWNAVDTW